MFCQKYQYWDVEVPGTQAHYHKITIRFKIVNNKKFDAVLQPTGGQCPGLQLMLVVTPRTDLCFKYSVW